MLSKITARKLTLSCLSAAFAVVLCLTSLAEAANIKVVPSATRVSPGENFYIDINVENIPQEGLGAVQFRLNIAAAGATVSGVSDTSQGKAGEVSVSSPLTVGPPTSSRSGIGDFFLNGKGTNGILIMDNEALNNGSGLYTFGHTNGSEPPTGSGSVARFHFAVGKDVTAEKIVVTLSEVMLLDAGAMYQLENNVGATIDLRCMTKVPNLVDLSKSDAQTALQSAGLLLGNIYEINNPNGAYALNRVLVQSQAAGTSVLCETPVDLAINTPPAEVAGVSVSDKTNDESGTVILSWTPSASSDTAGYRVYLISSPQSLLKEIMSPASTGIEIAGLTNGQVSQLKITAFDSFGNESQGVLVSATAVDDVAPRVSIDGIADGAFYSSSVTPSINVTDANLSTKEILLNGIAYAMAAIGIEGNYTLKVTAKDSSGNTTTKEIRFVIDRTPPVISVSGIEKGKYYSADLSPVISAVDSNLQSVTATLNGSAFVSGSAVSAEGSYELKIEASDKAGNRASDVYTFYIDKTKPVSGIAVGEPKFESGGNTTVTGSTLFTLTGKDEGAVSSGLNRLEYRYNNSSWNTYSSPFTLTGAADGSVAIDYRGVDKAGNIEDYRTLIVQADNTPPVTTIAADLKHTGSGTVYTAKNTVFTLAATDNISGVAKTEYRIDGGTWSVYAPFIVPSEGTHTIGYRSSDNLGNLETEKTLTIIVDNTAPVSVITAGNPQYQAGGKLYIAGNTEIIISASDSGSGVKKIEYGIDGGAFVTYTSPITLAASADGAHTITYRSTDNIGNIEADKMLEVVVDKTPPTTELKLGEPNYTSSQGVKFITSNTLITLIASDNLSGVSSTEYRIDGGSWTPYSPFKVNGEGSRTIEYRSTDNVGNVEAIKTFNVVIDNTPPVTEITTGDPKFTSSDGKLYATGNTVFALSSTDNLSGVAKTEYRIDNGAWTAYAPFKLTSEGTHTIGYRSIDNLGNAEAEKTLAVIVDNASPASAITVGDPKYQASEKLYISGKTTISITASDSGSGVSKIEYGIDNGPFAEYKGAINLSTYQEGSHTIYYRSTDNLGNVEDAKTLAVILDKSSPLTAISASDPLIDGVVNIVSPTTRFTLSSSDSLSGVKEMQYKIDGGAWQAYMANFSLSGLGAGAHTITYKAVDNVMNEEAEKSITVKLVIIDVSKSVSSGTSVLAAVFADNNDLQQKQADTVNLNSILSSLGVNYFIAQTTDEFTAALRSGRYNTYFLVDFKEPLIGDEIREAVHSGDGLIFIKTNPQADPFMDDVFGVKFTGKTTNSDLTVNLAESPISKESTIASSGKNVVATINSATAQSFGYVKDKNSTYSSVVYNGYKKGKVILYNFDLLYSKDQAKAKELILNSLGYVLPLENTPRALSSMPVNIKLGNNEEPVDVKVLETIPYRTTADTVIPQSPVSENMITWQKYLGAGEKATFGYYLNLPDTAGDYTANTEVQYSNNGYYRLYGNYGLTFSLPNDSAGLLQVIISYLRGISGVSDDDSGRITKALENLSAINADASSRKDAEQNIRLIANAIDEIRKLSFDSSEIRLRLDELLKIWEKKWYLMNA